MSVASEAVSAAVAAPAPSRYRYVALGLAAVNHFVVHVFWYTFPVYFVAVINEFDWPRGPTAAAFSSFALVAGLGGPISGGLTDRYGPRAVICIGTLILTVAAAAAAYVSELWQFFLCVGIVGGVGMCLAGWIPNVTAVSRWFPERVGTVAGLVSSAIGLSILFMVPVAQYLVGHVGWRNTYLLMAAWLLIGLLPSNLLLQRRPPVPATRPRAEAAGEGRPAADALVVNAAWAARVWTVRSAIRTWRFWFIGATFFCSGISTQLVFAHEIAFLIDSGISGETAAFAAGLVGLASVIAKIAYGPISDRIGRELTFSIAMVFVIAGIAALVSAGATASPGLIYLFPWLFGFGYSATATLNPAMVADIFRGRSFGAIFGAVAAISSVGSASGPWIAGTIFDVTGSYAAAFVTGVASCVLATVFAWLASPRRVRRPPRQIGRGRPD
ncbi:MAG: MFS transporter [Chloroflexota bacterium]